MNTFRDFSNFCCDVRYSTICALNAIMLPNNFPLFRSERDSSLSEKTSQLAQVQGWYYVNTAVVDDFAHIT